MRHRIRKRPMSEINVVPYIDVMLVLLVIFMITAPLLSQGVKIELPKVPSKPLQTDSDKDSGIDNLIVSVNSVGDFFVNYGANQEQPVNAADLTQRIAALLKYQPNIKVFVRGDTNARYGRVAGLMSLLQGAGVSSVGMITEPPEAEQ